MADDFRTMQQEAARRAREMYSRSRPGPATGNRAPAPQPEPPKEEKHQPEPEAPVHNHGNAHVANSGLPDIFETFFKDKEKMLILALLVILSQEECDNGLLFALMFLLL